MVGLLTGLPRKQKLRLATALLLGLSACSTTPVDYSVSDLPAVSRQLDYHLKSSTVSLADVEGIDQRSWAVAYYTQVPILFRRGLSKTLASVKAFNPAATRSATLAVSITKFDLPDESFAKSASITAIYRLAESDTGMPILEKTVETTSEVPVSHSFSGGQRRQEAVNIAVKSNIRKFLLELQGE